MYGTKMVAQTQSDVGKQTLAEAGLKKDANLFFQHTGLLGGTNTRVREFPSLNKWKQATPQSRLCATLYFVIHSRPALFDFTVAGVKDWEWQKRVTTFQKYEEQIMTRVEKEGMSNVRRDRRKVAYRKVCQMLETKQEEYDKLYFKVQELAMKKRIWITVVQKDEAYGRQQEKNQQVSILYLSCCCIFPLSYTFFCFVL